MLPPARIVSTSITFEYGAFDKVELIKSYADRDVALKAVVMHIERNLETRQFAHDLAEAAGTCSMNKVIYRVTTKDGSTFFVKLHNLSITIALGADGY